MRSPVLLAATFLALATGLPAHASTSGAYDRFPPLLKRLFSEERSFQERQVSDTGSARSFTFLSTGLPAECVKEQPAREQEVWVSLMQEKAASKTTKIQVLGARPTRLSTPCVLALVQETSNAKDSGLNLVSGNLSRIKEGGHLYLEFSVEGPQSEHLSNLLQSEIEARIAGHLWSEAMAWMILSLIALIWGLRYVVDPRPAAVTPLSGENA